MLKIILNGAGGRMGGAVREQVAGSADDTVLVAEIDKLSEDFSMHSIAEYKGEADVIIDFSHHSAVRELISYALGRSIPLVLSTTGHTEEEKALIYEAAKSVPIFYSANMSLGIAILTDFARRAAALLPGADIEIVEIHHNRKLDAPSGTALMIADAINAQAGGRYEYIYDRHDVRRKRGEQELGISAVRGGGIVGDHDVLFCGAEEVVTLSHVAQSRGVFADGAIQAALFLNGRAPGYYTMSDMLQGKLSCV